MFEKLVTKLSFFLPIYVLTENTHSLLSNNPTEFYILCIYTLYL